MSPCFADYRSKELTKIIHVECAGQEQVCTLELTLPSTASLESSSLSSVPSLYFKNKAKILIQSNICTIYVVNPKTVMKVKGKEDHKKKLWSDHEKKLCFSHHFMLETDLSSTSQDLLLGKEGRREKQEKGVKKKDCNMKIL